MKETLSGNMTGKICLVTGATNGIGKATALALPIAIAEIAFPLWLLIKGLTPNSGKNVFLNLQIALLHALAFNHPDYQE